MTSVKLGTPQCSGGQLCEDKVQFNLIITINDEVGPV